MSTLFLEGFGQLSPDTYLFDSEEEEDLYSVFLAHATLMGWCDTSTRRGPLLWGMEEAELTAGTDATRIGFVQVGLKPGVGGYRTLLWRATVTSSPSKPLVSVSSLRVTSPYCSAARLSIY